ncbi:MAG: Imm1 family immunity protein [Coleofasciculus sp. C1-SOL-03]|uniref:Imm1 family immunity protein n=1 Tax=Coleofasciculus sp. C1-SOL-03 TaxID=3069522 RepID=UPI0032FFE0BF
MMFVSNLSIEKWVGNENQGDFIEKPNWSQIEAAIRQLNGKNQTLVTLAADDETYMTIGGGSAGKYVVSVTFDNLDFYNLVDLSKPEATEKLVIGGQEGLYSAKMSVDLLRCLLAARTFSESGKLDSLLLWEEDKSLVTV